ncbi:hypothetical protein ACFFX1_24605 [Dactylosporangium sucinum]|uniref:DUF4878 domain-containing protein n=1 Tax=Dactylosporangium sucinum TaxID=1424081 RepID=A0A917X716_9ACTN|nr:hypothetical protein [Dactylosporangium sucinum]GGM84852.1 hypothetical protein GCM10007977_103100 [Dactylosporangium sucinum]
MMPPQVDEVPAPPAGPGVVAPFAAPPRDRDLKGLWIGLGVGGLVLVLCCVGGVLGGGFFISFADNLARTQVADAARGYLGALQAEDYERAHDEYLCAAQQSRHPVSWFRDHYAASPVVAFSVDENDVIIQQDIVVPATVQQKGQVQRTMEFVMSQEGTRYVICGGVE